MQPKSESPSDVQHWFQQKAADLRPALLGSLSLRRSPCIREHCPACLSGEQHPSYALYGRVAGRRLALYVPEEHEELIEKVRGDLQRGLKNPATGRNGLTPSQVLRSLILMRVKDWDYRELRERIADGYTLRTFTDFLSQPVPQTRCLQSCF